MREPITLKQILRHTTGFDETGDNGLASFNSNDQFLLADVVQKGLPARIRAAGEVTYYSNYAFSLAGLIAENISGIPFNEYVGAIGDNGAACPLASTKIL